MKICSICGRQVKEVVTPCLYRRQGHETCYDCCDRCHKNDLFYCRHYDMRAPKRRKDHE